MSTGARARGSALSIGPKHPYRDYPSRKRPAWPSTRSVLEGEVIVVDALLAPDTPGSVRVLAEAELSAVASSRLSSHGLGVVQAIALARALGRTADVMFVAVGIAAPTRGQAGLSPAVAAAIPIAAEAVLRLLGDRAPRIRGAARRS